MPQWADFPWANKMVANVDEAILRKAVAATENGYANASGGMSRFPGLLSFATFGGSRTYLYGHRGNMLAATDQGKLYRIDRSGTVQDVTGVPISGGKRVMFAQTEDQLVMCAGGPILKLSGVATQQLSPQAPQSTHVAFIDGYLVAIEPNSGRFSFCNPGEYEICDPASVFSANAKPDNLTALAVSPYREILLAGEDSVEQYETLTNGSQPFTRRWATGTGVMAPYTLMTDETGTYGVNGKQRFVRFIGQVSQDESADVGLVLENIDNWDEAWAQECSVKGQNLFVLQAPHATNAYGTKGVTVLFDYRNRRWSFLYGWDDIKKLPARWPGWSVLRIWGRMFVGTPGGVAEMKPTHYDLLGKPFPFLIRSAHVDQWGPSRIDDCQVRIRRGMGAYEGNGSVMPRIGLRVNRDQEGFDQWMFEDLGRPGERDMIVSFGTLGEASTWQIEIAITDPVPVEFTNMQVQVERLRW